MKSRNRKGRSNPEVGDMVTGVVKSEDKKEKKVSQITPMGLCIGVLIGLGLIWLLKKKSSSASASVSSNVSTNNSSVATSSSTTSSSTDNSPLTLEGCMAQTPAPWLSSPKKADFLAYTKTRTSDPIGLKSEWCQYWVDFNNQDQFAK
jgi:hypothetical protein